MAAEEDRVGVLIPCPPRDFGHFIAGLLSKPESMEGHVEGALDIQRTHISNVFHLIDQRVSKQNHGTRAAFSITVNYDNGTQVVHNNVGQFESYVPIDDASPVEVVLDFTYLLSFVGEDTPQKQRIEVVFARNGYLRDHIRYRARQTLGSGLFEYKINYTDRTWATDIAGLLKSHAEKIIEQDSKAVVFIRDHNDELGYLFLALSIITYVVLWLLVVTEAADNPDLPLAEMFKILAYGMGGLGILGTVIHALVKYMESLFLFRQSYICLAEHDNKKKEKNKNKFRRRIISLILVWMANIVTSVIASALVASLGQ